MSDNKIEREVIIESSKIIGNIGFGVKIKCEKEASKIKKKQGKYTAYFSGSVDRHFSIQGARPQQCVLSLSENKANLNQENKNLPL